MEYSLQHDDAVIRAFSIVWTTSLVFALLAVSEVVAAESPEKSEARALFERGVEAYQHGQFEVARTQFAESFSRRNMPEVLFNLAMTDRALGHHAQALSELDQYAHLAKSDALPPERRQKLEHVRSELAMKVGRIELVGRTPDMVISVDELPATADEMWVEPGKHVIVVARANAAPWTRSPSVLAGATFMLDVGALENKIAAPVFSPSSAATPTEDRPRARFLSTSHGRAAVALGVIGLGVLVGAAVTGGISISDRSDYDASCKHGTCNDAVYREGQTLSYATDVLIGLGSAAALTSIVLIATYPWRSKTKSISWSRAARCSRAGNFEIFF